MLKKYNKILDKISKIMTTEFDNKLVYDEKSLNTKIKSFGSKFNTNVHVEKYLNKVPITCVY